MWWALLILPLASSLTYRCQNDQILVVQSFGNDTIRMHCQRLDLCGYGKMSCEYSEDEARCGGQMNFVSHISQTAKHFSVEHTCCNLFNPRPPHEVPTHVGNDCFIYELPDGTNHTKKETEETTEAPYAILKSAADIPSQLDVASSFRMRFYPLRTKVPPTLLVKGIERRADGYRVTICRPRCIPYQTVGIYKPAEDGDWKYNGYSNPSSSWTEWADSVWTDNEGKMEERAREEPEGSGEDWKVEPMVVSKPEAPVVASKKPDVNEELVKDELLKELNKASDIEGDPDKVGIKIEHVDNLENSKESETSSFLTSGDIGESNDASNVQIAQAQPSGSGTTPAASTAGTTPAPSVAPLARDAASSSSSAAASSSGSSSIVVSESNDGSVQAQHDSGHDDQPTSTSPKPTTTTARPGSSDTQAMSCFPGDALVATPLGNKKMEEIQIGDYILVPSMSGVNKYERVEMFYHREPATWAQFVVIYTETGNRMALTAKHLLPFGDCEQLMSCILESDGLDVVMNGAQYANKAKVGQCVLSTGKNGALQVDKIIKIGRQFSQGIYSPMTVEGSLVVDGVLASCFSHYESHTVHKLIYDLMMYARSWFGYGAASPVREQDIPVFINYMNMLSSYLLPYSM